MATFRFVPVGPVRSGAQLWRSHGKLFATVVVKAAFAADGRWLDDCDPICEGDVHVDADPTKSLLDHSDLAPYLGTGEVLFAGAAYVPAGGRAQARLTVARGDRMLIDKQLIVRGPPGAGGGVTRVPITYENALGGPGVPANPVGQPNPLVVHASQSAEPASLGPIAPFWRARTSLLGASHKRPRPGPMLDLQSGFPWAYFHAAPPDQRSPEFFRGDEIIRLERLSPQSTGAELRLPGAQAEVRVLRSNRASLSIGFNADVLRVDGERLRTTVTWRGFFEVASEAESLVLAVGIRLPGRPVAWPPAAKGSTVELRPPKTHPGTDGAPTEPELDTTGAVNDEAIGSNTLPFAESPRAARSPSTPTPLPGAPWGARAAQVAIPLGGPTLDHVPRPAAIPARAPSSAPPPSPAMVRAAIVAPAPAPAPSPIPAAPPAMVEMTEGLGADLLLVVSSHRRATGEA